MDKEMWTYFLLNFFRFEYTRADLQRAREGNATRYREASGTPSLLNGIRNETEPR